MVIFDQTQLFLVNIYRSTATLYINIAGITLLSEEGTTQGDPHTMLMYALATFPLIE